MTSRVFILLAALTLTASAAIQRNDPLFRPGATCDYVIVVPNDPGFLSQVQRLAELKRQKGLQTRIATVDSILTAFPGVDSAAKVRTFLQHAWKSWGATWVLLAGDYSRVPGRTVKAPPATATTPSEIITSDIYYSCLEESWDPNGNGIYGDENSPVPGKEYEYDPVCGYDTAGIYGCTYTKRLLGIDPTPDVYLGRLPASTEQELGIMIDKIIAYGYTPRFGGGSLDMLLFGPTMRNRTGMSSGISESAYFWHNQIRPILTNATLSVFSPIKIDEVYEDSIDERGMLIADTILLTSARLAPYLNRGHNLVMYSAHGFSGGFTTTPSWVSLGTQQNFGIVDAQALQSPTMSNYMSNCCRIMDMQTGTCFAKEMLINPRGGAVSFAGSSSSDWNPAVSELLRIAVEHLSRGGITRPAVATQLAGVVVGRLEMYGRQFWGDPEMEIRTREVRPGDSLEIAIARAGDKLRVQVQDRIDSVLVCMYAPGKVLVRGYTQDGVVDFSTPGPETGEIRITATQRNYLPGSAVIGTGDFPSPVVVNKGIVTRDGSVQVAARGGRMELLSTNLMTRVELHDARGRLVASPQTAMGVSRVALPTLPPGIYSAVVQTALGRSVVRVRY